MSSKCRKGGACRLGVLEIYKKRSRTRALEINRIGVAPVGKLGRKSELNFNSVARVQWAKPKRDETGPGVKTSSFKYVRVRTVLWKSCDQIVAPSSTKPCKPHWHSQYLHAYGNERVNRSGKWLFECTRTSLIVCMRMLCGMTQRNFEDFLSVSIYVKCHLFRNQRNAVIIWISSFGDIISRFIWLHYLIIILCDNINTNTAKLSRSRAVQIPADDSHYCCSIPREYRRRYALGFRWFVVKATCFAL